MNIGIRLKELLDGSGMKQVELAKKLDVSTNTIQRWIKGEASPRTENLVQMANVFGIPVGYFTSERNESDDPSFVLLLDAPYAMNRNSSRLKTAALFDSADASAGMISLQVVEQDQEKWLVLLT